MRNVVEFFRGMGVSGVIMSALAFNMAVFPDAYAEGVAAVEHQIGAFAPAANFAQIPDDVLKAPQAAAVDEYEVRLLAATVWGEARSEGEDGMRAVAHVMVNRIGERFGEDLATVILTPRQFSVWNRGDPNRRLVLALTRDPGSVVAAGDESWEAAQRIAREVLSGQSVDPTDGALFYHTRAVRPSWARYGQGRQTIGAHIFYADVPDRGVRRTPRVVNVAHIFGQPIPIDGPAAERARGRVRGTLAQNDANAAATPTIDGVPITALRGR